MPIGKNKSQLNWNITFSALFSRQRLVHVHLITLILIKTQVVPRLRKVSFIVRCNPLGLLSPLPHSTAPWLVSIWGLLPCVWAAGALSRKLGRLEEIRRCNAFVYPAPGQRNILYVWSGTWIRFLSSLSLFLPLLPPSPSLLSSPSFSLSVSLSLPHKR